MKAIFLFVSILIPIILVGQRTTKINKYSVGIEIDLGHSFPNFDKEQDHWKGAFYPAGGINVVFVNRINKNWISDLGVGITGYSLTNKGSVDNYVLDFASPTISSGISYNFINRRGQENFIKLTSGFQMGYQGTFIDEFESYSVRIEGKHKLYQFIRPEIGIRRYFKQKIKGARYKMAYEFGAYFRYNFNYLGSATIREVDFETTIKPRGNIIGGYFKILFPVGKKRVRIKQESRDETAPIIYSPRNMK
jgi:hypothetical protein